MYLDSRCNQRPCLASGWAEKGMHPLVVLSSSLSCTTTIAASRLSFLVSLGSLFRAWRALRRRRRAYHRRRFSARRGGIGREREGSSLVGVYTS
jgi:hypothetical protein